MGREFDACKYLKDYYAQKHTVLLCDIARGKLHLFGDRDSVYVYVKGEHPYSLPYELTTIPLSEVMNTLKKAGFHGNYYYAHCVHIFEIWNEGGYNF